MSWEPCRDQHKVWRNRHIAHVVRIILAIWVAMAMLFSVASVAYAEEPVDAAQFDGGAQSEIMVQSDGDVPAEEPAFADDAVATGQVDANNGNTESTDNTDISEAETSEAQSPPDSETEVLGNADNAVTPESANDDVVGTIHADSVGFDPSNRDDMAIYELSGAGHKRTPATLRSVVAYPVAITNADRSRLVVPAATSVSTVADIFAWKFERKDDKTIRIAATVNGEKQYLRALEPGLSFVPDVKDWGITGKTVNPDDKDGYLQLSRKSDDVTYYLAAKTQEDGTVRFEPVTDVNDADTHLHVYYYDSKVATVDTQLPSNTIVNLFDYWTTTREGVDYYYEDPYTTAHPYNAWEQGINQGHALKFRRNGNTGNISGPPYNINTLNYHSSNHPNGRIVQGIVSNTLNGGYPQLAGGATLTGMNNSTESLAYLFDTTIANDYKASFRNVTGLFQKDSQGYLYYDSQQNYAELDESSNTFRVYNTNGIVPSTGGGDLGQFYPFNDFTTARASASRVQNHWFGMSMTTRFVQTHHGYTDSSHALPVTFEFSGDDDVWIFIDDVLVADIGGIASKRGVSIDFATGAVHIDEVVGSKNLPNLDTTLRQQFEQAGAATETKWNETNTTFADGTTHTLKFFFFERGNTDSNMRLKFNLTDIQPTTIYKVDQYGDALGGAEFGVYASNKEGQYLTDAGGAVVDTGPLDSVDVDVQSKNGTNVTVHTTSEGAHWYYDAQWNIHYLANNASTEQVIGNLYYGHTDSHGSMTFLNADDMPYGIDEIRGMFGDYFFVREVKVPLGYRTISDDILLHIDGDILRCLDTYQSGVWASADGQVTALNELTTSTESSERINSGAVTYKNDGIMSTDPGSAIEGSNLKSYAYTEGSYVKPLEVAQDGGVRRQYNIDYYDPEFGTSNGLLFAAVLKRNGKSGNETVFERMSCDDWDVVVGDDTHGYSVTQVPENMDNLSEVIAAAKTYKNDKGEYSHVFTPSAAGMQVTMQEMPGQQSQYYTHVIAMVQELEKDHPLTPQERAAYTKEVEYVVTYYWTSATSLDNATPENTVRVISHDLNLNNGEVSNRDFTVQWGGTIEIPNVENRLYFQKLSDSSEHGNHDTYVADAMFAMYPVGEDERDAQGNAAMYYMASDGTHVYLDADTDFDNKGTAHIGTPEGPEALWEIETGTHELYWPRGHGQNDASYVRESDGSTYGIIHVTDANGTLLHTIAPAKNALDVDLVGVTHDECSSVSENGTGHFGLVLDGTYVLREIEPPSGYARNTAEIKVLADSSGIYAHAGTTDNGVYVGNGLGYLVGTMDLFASADGIDETLRYVYMALAVDAERDNTFAGLAEDTWHYAQKNDNDVQGFGSGITGDLADAMVNYMTFDPDSQHSTFAYRSNTDQNPRTVPEGVSPRAYAGQTGERYTRLYADSGWTTLRVYQDTYFHPEHGSPMANYTDLGTQNIAQLFSNSTFVQVQDASYMDLSLRKIVRPETVEEGEEAPATEYLDGATFLVWKYAEDGKTRNYYAAKPASATSPPQWSADADQAIVFSGDNPTQENATREDKINDTTLVLGLTDGTYYVEEIASPEGYGRLAHPIGITISGGAMALLGEDAANKACDPVTANCNKPWAYTLLDAHNDKVEGTKYYTLHVANEATLVLPATGAGPRTPWLALTAVGVLALALVMAIAAGRDDGRNAPARTWNYRACFM